MHTAKVPLVIRYLGLFENQKSKTHAFMCISVYIWKQMEYVVFLCVFMIDYLCFACLLVCFQISSCNLLGLTMTAENKMLLFQTKLWIYLFVDYERHKLIPPFEKKKMRKRLACCTHTP